MNATVSVVIPVYNAARYVAEALESVFAQSYRDREVIVVDDGSSDNTSEVLKPYAGRVTVIRQENRGVYAARNRGVREARGAYLAFLDADDMWLPDKLELQVEVLRRDRSLGAVHSDATVIDEAGQVLRESANAFRQSRNGMVFDEFFEENMAVILLSTVMLRRECFDVLGPFDERFRMATDYGFFLEFAYHYPIACIQQPLVKYRLTSGSLSRGDAAENVACRERILAELIARHADYFTARPRTVRRKWRGFHRDAGFKLYYAGEYREARRRFGRVLGLRADIWLHYLLSALRGVGREKINHGLH